MDRFSALTKRLFIKTYGCQMNVYDSARMVDALAPLGYVLADLPDDADMIILNTCHIREKASDKVFSELGRLRALRMGGATPIIAVAGCVAQADGEEILARAPYVDIVLGPQTYHRLPEMVARVTRAAANGKRGVGILDTDFPPEPKFDHLPEVSTQGATAFLSVQEGCDKFCTFCVVPYTRGAEYSRPVDAVLAEARRLVDLGAREITLLGQNVNAYHGAAPTGGSDWGLGRLIRSLAEIPDLARIRYITSHPRDMDESLITAHRDVPTLMPFLHLPVQAGSDRILHAMNRSHSADDYRRLVAKLRDARPDLALASDFIVGFPGESDDEFSATLALIAETVFSQAYSFKYSPRPGTPAAVLEQVPESVKTERLERLQTLLSTQQMAFNQASVGLVVPVLLDRPGRNPGQLAGRTPHLQVVTVTLPGSGDLGKIVDLRIIQARPNSLAGEPVAAS